MPSKQTNSDVIAIEELVNEIKQNLRLKAAPPTAAGAAQTLHHPLLQPSSNDQFLQHQPNNLSHPQPQQLVIRKQRSRPSPYHIPCRSWSENTSSHRQRKPCKNDENNMEDPYELLQSLLKNNSLVKEAVRRLQINNAASAYSRKQNYFYDSDEDNRSPIVMMCQLES